MSLVRLLALLTALAVVGPVSLAQAHDADSYYDLRWDLLPVASLEGDIVLDWAFSPTFEDAARPDAISAAQVWNDTATRMTFRHVGDVPNDPGIGACPTSSILGDDVNVARRGEIDGPGFEGGGILALAALCPIPGTATAYHFTITYDESEPWHFGAPPIPADRFDLLGILAHEFGHATGWGRHFAEDTGTECINEQRHTMCSTVSPGTADPRTLEPHDIDTWQDAY